LPARCCSPAWQGLGCGGGVRGVDAVSDEPIPFRAAADIEPEQQRLAVSLRQVAHAIDRMPRERTPDLVRLVGAAEELFRNARLVFGRASVSESSVRFRRARVP